VTLRPGSVWLLANRAEVDVTRSSVATTRHRVALLIFFVGSSLLEGAEKLLKRKIPCQKTSSVAEDFEECAYL
jgi:hypothetical protein